MSQGINNLTPSSFSSAYYVCMFSHSVKSNSATSWTIARQAPLSMGFSKQECWRGLPFPPLGDLPDTGIEPMSLELAGGFFTTEPPEKPKNAN